MAEVARARVAGSEPEANRRPWLSRLTPLFLLTPASLFLLLIFVWAMAILLSFSFYTFSQGQIRREWSLGTWAKFFTDPFYWGMVGRSLRLGLLVTGLTLLVGYPTAYALARIRSRRVLVPACILIFSPLLVSVVVRSYGWTLLLSESGVVNKTLERLPFYAGPYRLMFNETGVVIALVHILLPFAVFPIVSVLLQLPPNLKEAAMDLGATRWQTFYKVVFPLSLPGVIGAAQIVFTLAISAFVTPVLLGGGRVLVLSRLVYDNISELNWPLAAVEAFVLLCLALAVLLLLNRLNRTMYVAKGG